MVAAVDEGIATINVSCLGYSLELVSFCVVTVVTRRSALPLML